MGIERTPRQRAADKALDEAIRENVAAYGRAEGCVITDWIVLGAGVGVDDDGDDLTAGFQLLPEGGYRTNWHQLFGMLRAAQLKLDRDYMALVEGGD